uniref:Uncharacterized protein n=1 Tax=Arundo donax TaxID=35708 RepID=A0A0A9E8E6_ARUDO
MSKLRYSNPDAEVKPMLSLSTQSSTQLG